MDERVVQFDTDVNARRTEVVKPALKDVKPGERTMRVLSKRQMKELVLYSPQHAARLEAADHTRGI